jgi:hypothetical protein
MLNKSFFGGTLLCACLFNAQFVLPGVNPLANYAMVLLLVLPVTYFFWLKRGYFMLRSIRWQRVFMVLLLILVLGLSALNNVAYKHFVVPYTFVDGTVTHVLMPFEPQGFLKKYLISNGEGNWSVLLQNEGYDNVNDELILSERENPWPFYKSKGILLLLISLHLMSAFALSVVFYLGSKASNIFNEKSGLTPLVAEIRSLIINDEFARACRKILESPAIRDIELKTEIDALYADFEMTEKNYLTKQIEFSEYSLARNRQNAAILKLIS